MNGPSNVTYVVEEKSRKKRRIFEPPEREIYIDLKGYPHRLLFELIGHVLQLDDASLLRSEHDMSAFERIWGDWFYRVIVMDSNEDRCKLFETTFDLFPNLANTKISASWTEHQAFPLFAMLYAWPAGAYLPTSLLDQIKAATRENNTSLEIIYIKCENKDEVAMWAMQHLHIRCPSYCLQCLIDRSFSVQVVMSFAETLKQNLYDTEEMFSKGLFAALHNRGGQYWNEQLLRLLWKGTNFKIHVGVDMPNCFRSLVVSELRKRPEIEMICSNPESVETEAKFAVPMVREMQSNTSLTKWTLDCHNAYDGWVNAVHDVLCHCSSLREFSSIATSQCPIKIPAMPYLEKLYLKRFILFPESLEPMMQTAREIFLEACELRFPPEATTTVPPVCFEGWTKGLLQNGCIEQLTIVDPFATGRFRVCGRAFIEAIASRPSLKVLDLFVSESAEDEGGSALNRRPEDMRKLGLMDSLESLHLRTCPPDGLKSLLGANPVWLRKIDIEDEFVMTKDDYLEYLNYLAHPKCKLVDVCFGKFQFLPSFDCEGDDDERLRSPVRSLLDVLRDHNCTLRKAGNFQIMTPQEKEELQFWCGMNRTCPNRLELRRELSLSYPDQIAKYMSSGSHSEAFELIRTTFHLWGC